MVNLAGVKDCDRTITNELEAAGITLWSVPSGNVAGEVPYTLEGRLGKFHFRRAWCYWVVRGLVSLRVANIIYDESLKLKEGKFGLPIRVDGSCACPKPTGAVDVFHIDTQEGLNKFVEIIRHEKI